VNPDIDPNRIVFLDRDGVINEDSPDFIKSWAEFTFLPRSLDALACLTQAGYQALIITNQSGVHRGLLTHDQLTHIHARMVQRIQSHGGRIADIFFCPHTPQEQCTCRKPRPGLIRKAVQRYNLVVEKTVMVGDSAKDMHCAVNARCGHRVLVQTGNGRKAQKELQLQKVSVDCVARDLFAAVQWIIARREA
jgi:D-glycero-D-manno-heptose 1,7-bisphosphate phosphatase